MSLDRRSGLDRRRRDIGPPRGQVERRRGNRIGEGGYDDDAALKIAMKAVQLYAESHPRPGHVTQEQAAEMLGISRATVSRMVKFGTLKLNKVGRIPMSDIDKALLVD
ncbi:MAG: helix-turn-helix domain-containing protein [Azonexus sp.]